MVAIYSPQQGASNNFFEQGKGKTSSTNCEHGARIAEKLELLKNPDNRLEVNALAVPCRGRTISLIGIIDRDPRRNLGDYQNMGYFLLADDLEGKAAAVDPGLREAGWIREALGIRRCDVIFTHFHLDHWIGYEAFCGERFFASPLCKTQRLTTNHHSGLHLLGGRCRTLVEGVNQRLNLGVIGYPVADPVYVLGSARQNVTVHLRTVHRFKGLSQFDQLSRAQISVHSAAQIPYQ